MRSLVAMLVVSLGCGGPPDVHRNTADAPEVDAIAADAALDAPGAALTTVTVFDDNHVVIVGINVYFQDADSNMIAVVATDTQGKASVVMPPGGHISYFDRAPQGLPRVWTFANILPGEELFFERVNTFRASVPYSGPLSLTHTVTVDDVPPGSMVNHTPYLISTDPVYWNSPRLRNESSVTVASGPFTTNVPVPAIGTIYDRVTVCAPSQPHCTGSRTWGPASANPTIHTTDSVRWIASDVAASQTEPALTWTEESTGVPANYVFMKTQEWRVMARVSGTSLRVPANLPSGSPSDPPVQMSGFPWPAFNYVSVAIFVSSSFSLMPHGFRENLWDDDALPPDAGPTGQISLTVWSR